MIRRPPRSTLSSSSAASDVYKRQFPAFSLLDYKKLFSTTGEDDAEDNFFIHTEVDAKTNTSIEVCVSDTPDESKMISYVNGMITRDGGTHVQAVYKILSQYLIQRIQPTGEPIHMDK